MIRVLIERRLNPGAQAEYQRLQRRMRGDALRDHSYVTGETWRDADDPTHYVTLSMWRSRSAWDAWAQSPARTEALALMGPLLQSETITVLELPPGHDG